jgi:hypothetical protein
MTVKNSNKIKSDLQLLPILIFAGGLFLSFGFLYVYPAANGPVAAFFPTNWTLKQTILAVATAGGTVQRRGGQDWIVIVEGKTEDWRQKLRQSGAWLVANPAIIGGCETLQLLKN